ncbi:MAG TPA: hypothetical protein EYP60_06165 [bacterium (Candidatus Stahlbacteria)]|nr:hypothetical protein [Candidatus Stahlbacteria bacterium]
MQNKTLVLLLTSLLGCTYSFKGFTTSGIRSIAIPVFENKTIKPGIEEVITQKIEDAFIRDNRLRVVAERDASSILLGKITSYNRVPFSYDENENVKDYKIEISLSITYKNKKGETLWEKELKEWTTYPVSETEEYGIEDVASKAAQDILRGTLEGW